MTEIRWLDEHLELTEEAKYELYLQSEIRRIGFIGHFMKNEFMKYLENNIVDQSPSYGGE